MTHVRAYIPLTAAQFAAGWPHLSEVSAYTPDAAGRALRGEAGEEAEFRAQLAAAEAVLTAALEEGAARVVLAADLPAALPRRRIGAGLEVIGPFELEAEAVVSLHVDDPDALTGLPADGDAAAAVLRASPLLWYDVSEAGDLIEAFAEQPLDGRGDS